MNTFHDFVLSHVHDVSPLARNVLFFFPLPIDFEYRRFETIASEHCFCQIGPTPPSFAALR